MCDPDGGVYTHFGAAALAAQLLEQNVLLALRLRVKSSAAKKLINLPEVTAVSLRTCELDRRTLGPLIRMLRQHFSLCDEDVESLAEALAIRNSLMHGYFPRNARNLTNPDGRRAMKRELDEAAEVLWQATLKVAPFVGQEAEQLLQVLVHAQFSE